MNSENGDFKKKESAFYSKYNTYRRQKQCTINNSLYFEGECIALKKKPQPALIDKFKNLIEAFKWLMSFKVSL